MSAGGRQAATARVHAQQISGGKVLIFSLLLLLLFLIRLVNSYFVLLFSNIVGARMEVRRSRCRRSFMPGETSGRCSGFPIIYWRILPSLTPSIWHPQYGISCDPRLKVSWSTSENVWRGLTPVQTWRRWRKREPSVHSRSSVWSASHDYPLSPLCHVGMCYAGTVHRGYFDALFVGYR